MPVANLFYLGVIINFTERQTCTPNLEVARL